MTDALSISKPLQPEDIKVEDGFLCIKDLVTIRIGTDAALSLAGNLLDFAIDRLRSRAEEAEQREAILQDILDKMEGYR